MTTNAPAIPPLAAAFQQADDAQWRLLVEKALKDSPFERLISRTSDGIEIQPLYPRAKDHPRRAFSGTPGRWDILARVDHPDATTANELARGECANGANGLHLVFAGSPGAYGFGLPADSGALAQTLRQILDGIDPAVTAIELDLPPAASMAPEALASIIISSGLNPASASISFGLDPLGAMTMTGSASPSWEQLAPTLAQKIAALAERGFAGPFCVADGRVIHAGGGSEAQELAFVLSCALAYLRALEMGGMPLAQASRALAFRLAADADQFLTIAKFRAMRRLWARVENACGLPPSNIHIHAETGWRMMTRYDPHVNLLRGTIAAFSAAIGGASSLSVLPYTQALGLPGAGARRLARNTQLILLEEANIARAADPAAGSGGLESLTDSLCGKAWALFQSFEKDGGAANEAVRAALAGLVHDIHTQRMKNIATRRAPITGVSEFPALEETPADVLMPPPCVAPARTSLALSPVRDAQAFEDLRDLAASLPQRPRVFLANLGDFANFNARTNFARTLFEAGGIESIAQDGADDLDALARAFARSGAHIACICSSDAVYSEQAASAARTLRSAGARKIWLAGRPGENETAFREGGIGGFAFAGCDAITLLKEALAQAA